MEKLHPTKLGSRLWFNVITFGLVGQIAWIVENMYFSKFMQNEIEHAAYATTLMVALSAITATVTTVVGGALCDRLGKRKIIICIGYILWGFSTMAFSLIPIDFSAEAKARLIAVVVIMDCVMSFIGSMSNDAAFNTWISDVTDNTNRAKVDTVLAIMPIAAMVVVFAGLDSLTGENGNWGLFFIILGIIPIVGGVLGLFLLKDGPNVIKNSDNTYWYNVFYSFRPSVIKDNRYLYIALLGSLFSGASLQVYQSYLINMIEETYGITNYIIPLGIIFLGAAVVSVIVGSAMDKYGKRSFYYPTIIFSVLGSLVIYFSYRFRGGPLALPLLCLGGVFVMAASLIMAGLFIADFRDNIPAGKEGSFQGIRMFLVVLIPMLIGPFTAQIIINKVNLLAADGSQLYPPELFLGGSVIVLLALIPAHIMRKHKAEESNKLKENAD